MRQLHVLCLTLTFSLLFVPHQLLCQEVSRISLVIRDFDSRLEYSILVPGVNEEPLLLLDKNGAVLDSFEIQDPFHYEDASIFSGRFLKVITKASLGSDVAQSNTTVFVAHNSTLHRALHFISHVGESVWDPPPFLATSKLGNCLERDYYTQLDTIHADSTIPMIVLHEHRRILWQKQGGTRFTESDNAQTRLDYDPQDQIFVHSEDAKSLASKTLKDINLKWQSWKYDGDSWTLLPERKPW